MSIFIGGLHPTELKTYVKEGATATYAQAYAQAKTCKECTLKNELGMYFDNT